LILVLIIFEIIH